MTEQFTLTKAGFEKLKSELEELKSERRPAVIARIKAAKEFGDLSENAEYEDARNEQAFIEGRIQEIEELLKRAQIISTEHNGTANIGSRVIVQVGTDKEEYELVGAAESDPPKGKISIESPLGRALYGHKAGDTVEVQTPAGVQNYSIINVE